MILQFFGRCAVEDHDGDAEGVPQRDTARQGVEVLAHASQHVVELTPGQVVLRGEVSEESAASYAAGRGDLINCDLIEAALDEQPQARVAYLGMRCGGMTPDAHHGVGRRLYELTQLSSPASSLRH